MFYTEEFSTVLHVRDKYKAVILHNYSLMMGQKGPKHVGVSAFVTLFLNQIHLCAFIVLNYNN